MNKRIILFIFMVVAIIFPSYRVEAKTMQDLYNSLADLEKKYNNAQNNKKLTENEISKLNKEITEVNNGIIKAKEDIKHAEDDIKISEDDIEEKKKESNEFLKFLQISSGDNTYLEFLFDAEDYTDLIYRYAVITQMSEHNNNLISDLEALIKELEEKKIVLGEKEKKLNIQLDEFNSKMNTLRANLDESKILGTTIEQDISDMKRQINYYKNLGCKDNQELSSCENIAYTSGWRHPLSYGCVTSEFTGDRIRDDWSGGGGHYGIDLSCAPEGSSVYPAADGTVARVVYYSSCGGNQVYIYHNVNGRKYTTNYMHLLSINVKVGQKVTTDTVIARMGGGSTATHNGGYDRCTTGTHLHFGVANGHSAFGFNGYAINPRNILKFPYGWSYFYRR